MSSRDQRRLLVADWYCDPSAVSSGAYSATPVAGGTTPTKPEDGNGRATGAATMATLVLQFVGIPTAGGTVTVAGVTFTAVASGATGNLPGQQAGQQLQCGLDLIQRERHNLLHPGVDMTRPNDRSHHMKFISLLLLALTAVAVLPTASLAQPAEPACTPASAPTPNTACGACGTGYRVGMIGLQTEQKPSLRVGVDGYWETCIVEPDITPGTACGAPGVGVLPAGARVARAEPGWRVDDRGRWVECDRPCIPPAGQHVCGQRGRTHARVCCGRLGKAAVTRVVIACCGTESWGHGSSGPAPCAGGSSSSARTALAQCGSRRAHPPRIATPPGAAATASRTTVDSAVLQCRSAATRRHLPPMGARGGYSVSRERGSSRRSAALVRLSCVGTLQRLASTGTTAVLWT